MPFPSISSIFGGGEQAQPQQPANTQVPAQEPQQQQPQQSPTQEPQKDVSPLEQFAKLWEDDSKPNQNNQDPNPKPDSQESSNQFNSAALNEEVLSKALSSLDFSSEVDTETLQAIVNGGEEGAKAFMAAMNNVAKKSVTQAILVSNKLTDKAVQQAVAEHSRNLPNTLRVTQARNELLNSNALFSNPALAPIIDATQHQLSQKFPEATPSQLTKMTMEYVSAIAQETSSALNLNQNTNPSNNPFKPQEDEDWSNFLG